jgi:hypothetical protein
MTFTIFTNILCGLTTITFNSFLMVLIIKKDLLYTVFDLHFLVILISSLVFYYTLLSSSVRMWRSSSQYTPQVDIESFVSRNMKDDSRDTYIRDVELTHRKFRIRDIVHICVPLVPVGFATDVFMCAFVYSTVPPFNFFQVFTVCFNHLVMVYLFIVYMYIALKYKIKHIYY